MAEPVVSTFPNSFIEMKGIRLMGVPIYLDMQATTPLDPRVLDAMLPFLTEEYGNPHSRTHMFGWESEDAVEVARKQASLSVISMVCACTSLLCWRFCLTNTSSLLSEGLGSWLSVNVHRGWGSH